MGSTRFDHWVATLRHGAAGHHVAPGTRVCDLGCGPEAWFVAGLEGAGMRIGFDHQPVRARPAGASFVRGDVTRPLPFRSESFDHVTMLAVLEHLPTPEGTLAESWRILAPGGSLILTWPSAVIDPMLDLLHRLGIVGHEMESSEHQPRRPWTEWREVLRSIGFADVHHRRFELGLNHLMVAHKPIAANASRSVPGAGGVS